MAAMLAIAGAAIGLGNVWRFPYMMGSYGGSAFLLIYLLFIALFAIPAVVAEWSLGREARGGSITAFSHALGGRWGRLVGYTLVAGICISGSYYIVVIGNIAYASWFSIVHGFSPADMGQFSQGLSDGALSYAFAVGTLGAISFVAYKGVNRGIESVSNFIVPFFFLVMLYLIYSTFQLPGSTEKMLEYLQPQFDRLTWTSVFAALGQAVFSVGLGGTVMLIYGSYLPEDAPLFRSATIAALADTVAALLAALFIFPTMLVFGVNPEAGPTLIFETLPRLFGEMAGGRVLGSFFLLALFLIAFLSGLAAFEVIVGSISDDSGKNGLDRKKCIAIFTVVEAVIMILPSFRPDVIQTMDLIFGSGMLATGCALAIVALTWFLNKQRVFAQFRLGPIRAHVIYYWLKFVLPLVFVIIFVGVIYSNG